eukprot:3459176-Rhodomonas_salina.1
MSRWMQSSSELESDSSEAEGIGSPGSPRSADTACALGQYWASRRRSIGRCVGQYLTSRSRSTGSTRVVDNLSTETLRAIDLGRRRGEERGCLLYTSPSPRDRG